MVAVVGTYTPIASGAEGGGKIRTGSLNGMLYSHVLAVYYVQGAVKCVMWSFDRAMLLVLWPRSLPPPPPPAQRAKGTPRARFIFTTTATHSLLQHSLLCSRLALTLSLTQLSYNIHAQRRPPLHCGLSPLSAHTVVRCKRRHGQEREKRSSSHISRFGAPPM